MSPHQLKLNIKRMQEMWLRLMEQKRLLNQQTTLRKQQADFDNKMFLYLRSPKLSFQQRHPINKKEVILSTPKKTPPKKHITPQQPLISSIHASFFNLYLRLFKSLREKQHYQNQLVQKELMKKKQAEIKAAEQEKTQRFGL